MKWKSKDGHCQISNRSTLEENHPFGADLFFTNYFSNDKKLGNSAERNIFILYRVLIRSFFYFMKFMDLDNSKHTKIFCFAKKFLMFKYT